jgi:hypothetical protein
MSSPISLFGGREQSAVEKTREDEYTPHDARIQPRQSLNANLTHRIERCLRD